MIKNIEISQKEYATNSNNIDSWCFLKN
jgi:hypothetical protein